MNCCRFLFGAVVLTTLVSCSSKKVNIESLLEEMTDKTAITYFPEKEYRLKQFSSYDRKSVSPDSSGWWANADYTQFIREENKDGRREFVLFDARGPGVIVRYWMTFAGEGASAGTLRIYIDNNKKPEVEGNVLDILSGGQIAPDPLTSSVSPETEYQRRGHNLYFPIPYAQNCKITYECDALKFENNRWSPSIYYNINYRTYVIGTKVESFSNAAWGKSKDLINETAKKLLSKEYFTKVEQSISTVIPIGDSLNFDLDKKGRAIAEIGVRLDADDINQALRSTVLAITFDREETVWVPVGDFFGTGYQFNTSKTWYSEVDEDGKMIAKWIMPYENSAKINLINFGKESVDVDLSISTIDYKWKNSSMYFGASWHEYNRINTAKDSTMESHNWHFDVNYVDLKGEGVYAGDALTVFNTAEAWWGEGDEKIFVDGETFPSSIGTGTEDYYGYAWCRPEKFTHPFIAQPTGAGNFHSGMSVNMRYRSLDAIPFTSEISSNIEMWHWVKTKVNFGMTAFWYAKPGFATNIKPDIKTVQIPVALKRSDIYSPVVDNQGKIEGEYLDVVSVDSGNAGPQSGNFGWSGNNQLWWRNGNEGDELVAKFILNETGKYRVSAQLTKAVDYGIIQIYINNSPVGSKFNGYQPNGVTPVLVNLGSLTLSEGENILKMKIIGADKNAKPGNMAGIDILEFERVL